MNEAREKAERIALNSVTNFFDESERSTACALDVVRDLKDAGVLIRMDRRSLLVDIKVCEFEDGSTVNEFTYRAHLGAEAPDYVTLTAGIVAAVLNPAGSGGVR